MTPQPDPAATSPADPAAASPGDRVAGERSESGVSRSPERDSRPVLIFDGDCGFCTTTARFAQRWIARESQYAVQPWQDLDLASYGLTEADCVAAAQFVDATGTASAGHLAIAAALRHGSPPWPPLGVVMAAPGVRHLAAVTYHWVSEHRYAMPGGTPVCDPNADFDTRSQARATQSKG